jgi:hypothetical protein
MRDIESLLQQFNMLDKCTQICQENNDIDGLFDTYYAMKKLVVEYKYMHEEFFAEYPQYQEAFKTLEELR